MARWNEDLNTEARVADWGEHPDDVECSAYEDLNEKPTFHCEGTAAQNV